MPYTQPPASALDFVLLKAGYVPPPASATDFELSAGGGLYYPPIPGLITDIQTPWRPSPGAEDADLDAAFQVAVQLDSTRTLNADQASKPLAPEVGVPFQEATAFNKNKALAWDPVADKDATRQMLHSQATPRDIEARESPWEAASKWIDFEKASPFLVKTPWKDQTRGARFFSSDLYGEIWRRKDNTPAPLAKVAPGLADLGFRMLQKWNDSDLYVLAPIWGEHPSQPKDAQWIFSAAQGVARDLHHDLVWGPAGQRDTTLRFVYPDYPGPIDFPDTFTIPTLRFYIVANTVQIIRVSDGRDIPCTSATLSASTDNFTWSFRGVLAKAAARALVEGLDGEPVEVDVIINGNTWRILVDAWDGSEAFAQHKVSISGRSRSAYLAAPYVVPRDYVEGSTLLAQQLAAQELPPGWTLDWDMTDWIIPAGAFQYQGLTPIEAITRLATAGGGFVNVHPDQDIIQVKQLLPSAAWELDTLGPDFQIPHSVMLQRGSRKTPGLGVNGVYVLGGSVSPYHAEVIRRQTNGTPLGATVVDPLITDRNPAEFRGINALAETLRQSQDTYELPLSATLGGVVPVGSLVEIGENFGQNFMVDWRGLVRGVNVSATAIKAGNGGVALRIRQGLDVVRYFED